MSHDPPSRGGYGKTSLEPTRWEGDRGGPDSDKEDPPSLPSPGGWVYRGPRESVGLGPSSQSDRSTRGPVRQDFASGGFGSQGESRPGGISWGVLPN